MSTQVLGAGGFGLVVRAKDATAFGAGAGFVAIKVMLSAGWKNGVPFEQDEVKRMTREARVAMKVKHENICLCYDMCLTQSRSMFFMPMEYLDGEPLDQQLLRAGAIAAAEVRRVAAHIGAALCKLHSVGMVHRDMKPANIISNSGVDPTALRIYKLIDFG